MTNKWKGYSTREMYSYGNESLNCQIPHYQIVGPQTIFDIKECDCKDYKAAIWCLVKLLWSSYWLQATKLYNWKLLTVFELYPQKDQTKHI